MPHQSAKRAAPASAARPIVVETHMQAVAASRSKPAKILVNKKLLTKYADVLRKARLRGAKVTSLIDKIDSKRTGKDTHAEVGGGWFDDVLDGVKSVASVASSVAPVVASFL